MPLLKNAKKALRVTRRKTVVNRRVKSIVSTIMEKMKAEPTVLNLQAAFSAIDTAAKRNIFHRNKAARHKSQLAKLLPSK